MIWTPVIMAVASAMVAHQEAVKARELFGVERPRYGGQGPTKRVEDWKQRAPYTCSHCHTTYVRSNTVIRCPSCGAPE